MRKNKILSILCCISALTAIALPVNAKIDENLKEFTMPLFHVYGIRNKEKTKLAGKIAQEIKYIPAQIDVVDSKKIKKLGADNLHKALAYEAGIVGNVQGDSPVKSFPKIRGFDVSEENILVDGMKTFSTKAGRFLVNHNQELYGMERVEILRGPSSTIGGAGSVSGIINMELKAPKENDFSQIEMKIGQRNEKVVHLDINRASENNKIATRFVGSFGKKDLFTDYSNHSRMYFAPSITLKMNEKSKFTIKPFYQKDDIKGFVGPSYNLLGDPGLFDHIPETAFFGVKGWDKYDLKQKGLNYEFNHNFDENVSFTHKGTFRKTNIDLQQINITYRNNRRKKEKTISRMAEKALINANSYSLDQFVTWHKEAKNLHRDTVVGFDYQHEKNNMKYQTENLDAWKLEEVPDYLSGKRKIKAPKMDGKFSEKETWKKEYGIYATHNEQRGKWHYSLGIRHGRYDVFGTNDNELNFKATTGQAGIVYELTDSLLPYIHWNNSFHPTIVLDINDKLLPPKRGKEWEVGLRYEPKNKHVKASIAFFDLKEQNKPVTYTDFVPGTFNLKNYAEAIGEVGSRGMEVKWHGEIANDWHVTGSYNYVKTKILKDKEGKAGNIGKELPNTPRHTFNLMLEKEIYKSDKTEIAFGIGMRYIGERKTATNNKTLPGTTVYDATMSVERGNGTWRLQVNNIFNKQYNLSLSELGSYYRGFKGDERSVTLSYEHRW